MKGRRLLFPVAGQLVSSEYHLQLVLRREFVQFCLRGAVRAEAALSSQLLPGRLRMRTSVSATQLLSACSLSPGFLTDDLVSQEDNGEQKKYLGVCRLPGPARRHRRLDIIVVPYGEFACALLYFTGSAHFNRSMRALAKTKGMSLSEHALSSAVVRGPGGVKVLPGHILPTPTERDVFIRLGLPYREPSERDW